MCLDGKSRRMRIVDFTGSGSDTRGILCVYFGYLDIGLLGWVFTRMSVRLVYISLGCISDR